MRIAVVGAGIAGLSLALWLRRAGLTCTIYEQAPAMSEVGAGIQLTPNAVRLLERAGLSELDSVAVRLEALDLRRWDDGAVLASTELGEACRRRYGAPYLAVHRADLQRLLLDAVREGGTQVRLGRRCVSVEHRTDGLARVRFDTGEFADADLVVGADGVRSAVRAIVSPDQARFTGVTAYRTLVDASRLSGSMASSRDPRVNVWLGPGRHCVIYPVSAGRRYNVVAAIARSRPATSGSWRSAVRIVEMRRAFRGWHPEVQAVLAAAQDVTCWDLYDRAPMDRWSHGRVTVVGDAAHAMLPFGSQGANQAIEGAASLAMCLQAAGFDVASALERYERLRRSRLAHVRRFVQRNAGDHHLIDGASQRARDEVLMSQDRSGTYDWLYGHDAEAEALAA